MLKFKRHFLFIIGAAAVIYGIYVFVFGILPYAVPKSCYEETNTERFFNSSPGSDRAVLIEHPQDAFKRRVELIRSAENELSVVCHCAKPGETTECFFAEILKAADRGVYVRILWDGMVSGFTGSHKNIDLALRSHPNIDYREYNPTSILKPWKWNARLHDKFIIADDKIMMLGGRNIGDMYFDPPGYEGSVTNDRDVIIVNASDTIENSVIKETKAYMDELFNAAETKSFPPLSKSKQKKGIDEAQRMRNISDKWEKAYPEYYYPTDPVKDISHPTNKITLLHNPVSSQKKQPTMGKELTDLLKTCKDITIQTPYATANKDLLSSLKTIADESDVRFLTNSLASTPNLPAFSVYLTNRNKFFDAGLKLYEYQSTDSIHGKGATADTRLSVIGSYNLDDRSIYIDTESCLVIDSPEFYKEMNQELEKLLDNSAKVSDEGKYVEGSAITSVSAVKKAVTYIVSVFSNLFEFLI